ncbi:hypothetical protein, partial [Mycoplasma phocimorsus]|uniref:hypothetical protein n=1 Tax=Mycoplasma phocimorsus TaxID=3045839 RepID=UPI0024C04BFC
MRFYGDGRAELNPKKGDGFELKIEWIEKPQIVFKGENDDWSFKIPLETGVDFVGEKVLKMPSKKTIEDAIKAKRKKVKRMYWSNNGESYAERAVRKSELSDFSEIWVKVETEDFGTVRVPYKVNLETGEEAYNIIEKTQDGKVKQESLPTTIEIKRKTSWETEHSTNNPVLDKRTKSEKEAGLVLVGWTTKPGGTKPIKFENGESKEVINEEQLYPILKSDGWAEKEKARAAIDWAATVAQAGLIIAEAAAWNGEEKHYKTAWRAVGIANKLFQIFLGGTIDSNILRDIKEEAASIAYDYANEHWHFIKGAEILAEIILDIQEFIMQRSREKGNQSAFNASWKSKDKIWKIEQYEAQKKEEFAQRNFKDLVGWLFAMFYQNEK